MARGSWQGLYNDAIDGLMLQRREQELLLLMAIARYCDPFGFCFPGRINLMRTRRISQTIYERRLQWLQDNAYVVVTESYDYRRRQTQFDFQVNPRVLYVREEIQEYCEQVFDGIQERDYDFEKGFLEILFSTKESQPEYHPESESDSDPAEGSKSKTRNHNQLRGAHGQKGSNPSTMRNQPKAKQQPTAKREAHRKPNPQAAGPDVDDLDSLLFADPEDVVQAIRFIAPTSPTQARKAVATYPRNAIVHHLRLTANRKKAGDLSNPGAWFFKSLTSQTPLPKEHWDETWIEQSDYQDKQNDQNSDDMEI